MELKNYLHERFAQRTAHGYGLMIERYCNQVSNATQAKYKDVLSYLEQERSKGRKANTLLTYIASIKVYYDWLKKIGKRKDHPCKHMRLKDRIDHRVNVQDLFSSTNRNTL